MLLLFNKLSNFFMRKLLGVLPVIFAAMFAYAAYYFYFNFPETRVDIGKEPSYRLVVKNGASLNSVLKHLADDGLIEHPKVAKLYARVAELTNIRRGEYIVKRNDTLLDVLNMLNEGRVTYRSVTLIEGWSLLQVEKRLAETFSKDTLSLNANEMGVKSGNLEGWVFPDTYFYSADEDPSVIALQAVEKMREVLAQQWQLRDSNLPYQNPYDMLIMASLIEKETGADHERELIASVFINRLRKKMKLQTDPTVIYALSASYDGNIRKKDLSVDSPYNTYRYKGLPPTPIAMPGLRSLQAAAKPASSPFLYFVAKGNGEHQFSTTLAEHNKAVDRYQRYKRVQDYRSSPAGSQ